MKPGKAAIIAGDAHPGLAREIARQAGVPLVPVAIERAPLAQRAATNRFTPGS